MLLAPAVARAAHRFDEASILQAANAVRALTCVAGGAVLITDAAPASTAVLTTAVLLGCLDQFFGPARAAAAQRNLREHERVHFGALNFLALSGIGLVSAATTPPMFAAGGLVLWLAVGAACSALSAALLALGYSSDRDLRPRPPRSAGRSESILSVARFALSGGKAVSLVTWSLVGYGFALGLTNQTMTPLALDGLHIPVARYAWIPTAFAIGGLAAYGITRGVATRWSTTTGLTAGATLLCLGYLAYGLSPALATSVIAMLVAGVGFGLWSSVQGAILQAVVPNHRMAAFIAVTGTLSLAATLAGSQLGRWLVHTSTASGHALAGYRISYVTAAAAVLACAALRRMGLRE